MAYRAFYGNSSFQDPEIDRKEKAFSDFICQIITKGIESGDINTNVDLEMAVFAVDTLINAFNNSYVPQQTGTTADALAEKGSSGLDIELVKGQFAKLMQILKFGLFGQQNNQ